MKIKLFILMLIAFASFAYAEEFNENIEDSDFFYVHFDNSLNLSTVNGIYSPFFGIGGRQIYGKNGIDWNASVEIYDLIRSKGKLLSYYANGNYIRFLKSERKNKYYYGGGLSFIGVYSKNFFYLIRSPTFILGKQIYEKNKIYIIQLKINWPNYPNIWVNEYFYRISKHERNRRTWAANIFVTTGISF